MSNKKMPLYKCPWSSLTPSEKDRYRAYLSVISEVRRSENTLAPLSLTDVCRERHVSKEALIRNMQPAFQKIGGQWRVTSWDTIPRRLKINEKGREVSITVTDSRTATVISQYHNSVKNYFQGLATAKSRPDKKLLYDRYLKPYEGVTVKDAEGRVHTLETDTDKLRVVLDSIEEPEFYEIYDNME